MKTIPSLCSFVLMLILLTNDRNADAQTSNNNPYPRTIVVEGSAEMEVVPDEVYVNFTLQEYNKKGEGKQDIDTLKNHFLTSCRKVGIADSNIHVVRYGGGNLPMLRKQRRNPDLMASITYEIRFGTSTMLDQLNALLDDEATSSFSIASTSHSSASQFRKELKIKAIKAAKEKAIYLAAAIGEEVGAAIKIEEDDDDGRGNGRIFAGNVVVSQSAANRFEAYEGNKSDAVAFRKIKYRYVMKAMFALK